MWLQEKQRCSVCGQRGVEQPVRAGRPSDRLQGGAKDLGQVGGQAYRPQQNPCLLHGHVSQPLHVSFSLFSALTTTSFLSFLFRCTIRPRQYQYPTLVLISSCCYRHGVTNNSLSCWVVISDPLTWSTTTSTSLIRLLLAYCARAKATDQILGQRHTPTSTQLLPTNKRLSAQLDQGFAFPMKRID